jgi:hypothetical protein
VKKQFIGVIFSLTVSAAPAAADRVRVVYGPDSRVYVVKGQETSGYRRDQLIPDVSINDCKAYVEQFGSISWRTLVINKCLTWHQFQAKQKANKGDTWDYIFRYQFSDQKETLYQDWSAHVATKSECLDQVRGIKAEHKKQNPKYLGNKVFALDCISQKHADEEYIRNTPTLEQMRAGEETEVGEGWDE